MQLKQTINWQDPLATAAYIAQEYDYCAFLYSAADVGYSGQFSILAYGDKEHVKSADFQGLKNRLSANQDRFDNAWFGYLSYDLKNSLEHLTIDKNSGFKLPKLWMINYRNLMIFDHHNKSIEILSDDVNYEVPIESESENRVIKTQNLSSNMSKSQYLQKVEQIKEAIINGDLYEANLTRKFYAELDITSQKQNFEIFRQLSAISPSAYSGYFQFKEHSVTSSSPEQFLTIDSVGQVSSRPIKGSAKRNQDPKQDKKSLQSLTNSPKDRAENLMIVDVVRNDLSKNSQIGSVKTDELFTVTSYPTIHHMYSTITAQKSANKSTLELVRGAFPPASMTGAPKIQAMQLCSALEIDARNIYSGCIGWFGGDGSADLSVTIRTIITDGEKIEFQVGGAITIDSIPTDEWQETITKAQAIARILNIKIDELEVVL